jgi:BNR repeat-containing family member
MTEGGNSSAGSGAGAAGMAGVSGTGGGGNVEPGVTKDGEAKLSGAGLSIVSYGGYLNGEAFQQDGVVTSKGYQYTAFWNTAHHVVMARRALPSGAWASFEFSDYTNTEGDAHNTISLGITEADGTLHVAFDHHGSPLHYRKSQAGLLSDPANAAWVASSFDATASSLLAGVNVTDVTYPRFISEPGGDKTLFSARLGSSGSGDEYLWEYNASTHAWTSLGKYLDGIIDNINAYLHGLAYEPGGTRLHAAWCWRDTPDASTNHGLLYLYSDDNGRTWRNNAGASVGTSGTAAVHSSSSGIEVWAIKQNRGLINQEHMIVDAAGRVHVLLSHMPDAQADDATFDSARTKSQSFHYWRDTSGKWTRTAVGLPVVAGSRGRLAVSSSGNLYAILPDLRIAGASLGSGFKTWSLLEHTDEARFFSDPLVDTARLLSEDKLSVVYQQKSSPNIFVLDYTLK